MNKLNPKLEVKDPLSIMRTCLAVDIVNENAWQDEVIWTVSQEFESAEKYVEAKVPLEKQFRFDNGLLYIQVGEATWTVCADDVIRHDKLGTEHVGYAANLATMVVAVNANVPFQIKCKSMPTKYRSNKSTINSALTHNVDLLDEEGNPLTKKQVTDAIEVAKSEKTTETTTEEDMEKKAFDVILEHLLPAGGMTTQQSKVVKCLADTLTQWQGLSQAGKAQLKHVVFIHMSDMLSDVPPTKSKEEKE